MPQPLSAQIIAEWLQSKADECEPSSACVRYWDSFIPKSETKGVWIGRLDGYIIIAACESDGASSAWQEDGLGSEAKAVRQRQ